MSYYSGVDSRSAQGHALDDEYDVEASTRAQEPSGATQGPRKAHDPIPDGKTGPWCRERHNKDADGRYVHDPRCGGCNV